MNKYMNDLPNQLAYMTFSFCNFIYFDQCYLIFWGRRRRLHFSRISRWVFWKLFTHTLFWYFCTHPIETYHLYWSFSSELSRSFSAHGHPVLFPRRLTSMDGIICSSWALATWRTSSKILRRCLGFLHKDSNFAVAVLHYLRSPFISSIYHLHLILLENEGRTVFHCC